MFAAASQDQLICEENVFSWLKPKRKSTESRERHFSWTSSAIFESNFIAKKLDDQLLRQKRMQRFSRFNKASNPGKFLAFTTVHFVMESGPFPKVFHAVFAQVPIEWKHTKLNLNYSSTIRGGPFYLHQFKLKPSN